MLTKTRRTIAATAVVAAAVTGVAACGTAGPSSSDPHGAVSDSVQKLLAGDALTVTLKLDTTPAEFKALAAKGSDPATLTTAQATAIANGSIVFAVKSGGGSLRDSAKSNDAATKGAFDFAINAGDAPGLIEVRVVAGDLYARVNVQQIASYGGSDISQLEQFAANPNLSFLKPAIEGKWVNLPLADLLSFAKTATKQTEPSVAPSAQAALEDALTNVLSKDVTAVKGADGGALGDHYVLSGSSRTIATDLVNALKSQLASIPGASKAFDSADPTSVPDKIVKIDAYVKGGKLSTLKLDITQFLSGEDLAAFDGKPFYIEADIADSADISAPAGATTINVGQIIGSLTQLDSGLSSDGSGAS